MEVANSTKARYIGFLSERKLTVYVIKNHFNVSERDIIDESYQLINQSKIGIQERKIVFNIENNLKKGGVK